MISRMAMEDIELLQSQGYTLTPRDIIRLNVFGLKVEKSTDSAEMTALPRVAILDDLIFHEPTIGSEIWFQQASRLFNMSDIDTYMVIRAYSLLFPCDKLVSLEDKANVEAQMKETIASKLKGHTVRQIMSAIEYVINGNSQCEGEKCPTRKIESDEEQENDECDDSEKSFEVGLLHTGIVLKLGTIEELKKMTTSELYLLTEYKQELKFGSVKIKSQHQQNLANYYMVLDEIKEKHGKDNT